jgi:hypothetical protein
VPESLVTRIPLGALFLLLVVFPLSATAGDPGSAPIRVDELTHAIPARSLGDLTGSQFVHFVSKMDARDREQAILAEISKGNLPDFLRKLVPVKVRGELASGKDLIATIFVTPDYLAIGSDSDFLRIPMNLHTAVAVAQRFGFVLPTRKIVDAIYLQSRYHLVPQPLPAGPQMRSTDYYWTHNELIEDQTRAIGAQLGELVSGDKKDVVMSNRLALHLGRIAIYGWHRGAGEPIQPLSTVHGANYADYSHGIRLVSEWAVVNGKVQSVRDILHDPSTAAILSDEGPIRVDGRFLAAQWDASATPASRNN